MAAAPTAINNADKRVIFKNCALFTDCLIKINNIHVENAKYNDIIMPYNLIEYSDGYSKISGYVSLGQYCWDKPAVNKHGVIAAFDVANVTDSFHLKKSNSK